MDETVIAGAALTCTSYKQLARIFEQVERINVMADDAVSFCEWVGPGYVRGDTKNDVWLCTLIVGEDDLDDLACSVRAWADERDSALEILKGVSSLIAKKFRRVPEPVTTSGTHKPTK